MWHDVFSAEKFLNGIPTFFWKSSVYRFKQITIYQLIEIGVLKLTKSGSSKRFPSQSSTLTLFVWLFFLYVLVSGAQGRKFQELKMIRGINYYLPDFFPQNTSKREKVWKFNCSKPRPTVTLSFHVRLVRRRHEMYIFLYKK